MANEKIEELSKALADYSGKFQDVSKQIDDIKSLVDLIRNNYEKKLAEYDKALEELKKVVDSLSSEIKNFDEKAQNLAINITAAQGIPDPPKDEARVVTVNDLEEEIKKISDPKIRTEFLMKHKDVFKRK